MGILQNVILSLLSVYEIVLFIRVILSWVVAFNQEWTPRGPLLIVSELVYTLTDPPLRLIRRVIKPFRVGGMALDLSVIVLFLVIFLVGYLVSALFFYL
jgi:YggT family protein